MAHEKRTENETGIPDHQHHARYCRAIKNAIDGFCVVDTHGKIIEVNKACCMMLGYSEEELMALTILDIEAKEDPAEIAAHIIAVKKEGYGRFETKHRCKNGRILYVDVSTTYLPDEDVFVSFLRDNTRQKEAALELTRAKKEFEQVFNTQLDAILILDNETLPRVTTCNQAASTIFGYSSHELVGSSVRYLHVDETHMIAFREHLSAVIGRTGMLKNYQTIMKRKNGEVFPAEISVFERKNDAGVRDGWVTIIKDRSEMQEAKKALIESENKFKKLYERAPLSYQSLDENGNFIAVNDTWLHLLGYEKHDVIGKNFSEFLHPDWQAHFKENFPRFKAVGEVLGVEFEMIKKDGTQILVSFHGKIGRDSNNEFQQTHCIFQDITTNRMIQKEAEKNKTILLEAEKMAGLGGWQWEPDRDLWTVSQNWLVIHGSAVTHLSTKSLLKIVHPNDRADFQKALDNVTKEETVIDSEFRIIHQVSGDIKHIYVYGESHIDDATEEVIVFGASQDITTQKKLEAAVLQAQKMESIGDLAGGIAHDFNNILFPIVGMAELLMEDLPPGSLEHENATEILKAGKRGSELVKQILSFSRQDDQAVVPVRPQKVLREVLKLVRATLPSNIDVFENIQADCGMVKADPTQLHQIGMNFITNAYHAVSLKNGFIEINLKEVVLEHPEFEGDTLPPGRYVMLQVADNGTGIRSEHLNKIFDPYFTTKKKGRGTGLGLAVVFGIVKEYKGDIRVYSELDQGTTFTVYLPLMESGASGIVSEQRPDLPRGTEKILLVDDERSVAQLETKMLERLGYIVTFETESLKALQVFEADPKAYDLVITDMTMPNMTGDQLAEKIKQINPAVPIVVCTGFSEKMSFAQAAETSLVQGFLMKPVIKSDLAQMVRKVLDESML